MSAPSQLVYVFGFILMFVYLPFTCLQNILLTHRHVIYPNKVIRKVCHWWIEPGRQKAQLMFSVDSSSPFVFSTALSVNNRFYLNGNWEIHSPGTFTAAGALFTYQRQRDGYEMLTTPGPINALVQISVSWMFSSSTRVVSNFGLRLCRIFRCGKDVWQSTLKRHRSETRPLVTHVH